jgi:hypothetical protein
LGNRSHSALVVSHKDWKYNPILVLLKPEALNKIKVSFAPQKRIKEHYGKVKETVKRKHLPPQNPMQPVETWIALVRTRNVEENETLSRSLFRKMIPRRRLQIRSHATALDLHSPSAFTDNSLHVAESHMID